MYISQVSMKPNMKNTPKSGKHENKPRETQFVFLKQQLYSDAERDIDQISSVPYKENIYRQNASTRQCPRCLKIQVYVYLTPGPTSIFWTLPFKPYLHSLTERKTVQAEFRSLVTSNLNCLYTVPKAPARSPFQKETRPLAI